MKSFVDSPDPQIYLSQNYVVLDFETTNIDFGNAAVPENRLLLACWKIPGSAVRPLWGSVYDIAELVAACEAADFIVAHNAKMELKWLLRAGADLTKILVWDTMIGEYVQLGNRKQELTLDYVSQKYGHGAKEFYVQKLLDAGVCPSQMPRRPVQRRCMRDVQQTEAVFKSQLKELQRNKLLPVQYTRCFATPMLADMEMRGLKLDAARVLPEYESVNAELIEVENELSRFTGGVNQNSPKQVAKYLYTTLGFEPLKVRGEPKFGTDQDTILSLVPKTEEQKRFIELKLRYADLYAKVSKTLSKFSECCSNGDLLFGNFNQCVTATHRLSSNGTKYKIQFQNMPREYKDMFMARYPGWLVAEIDGAQLEFRVAVYLGQDYTGYLSILNGEDVHSFTAQVLTEAGEKTSRQDAKEHTFKPLYGGMSGTKAQRKYYEAFRTKYPGIAKTQMDWQYEVLRSKSLKLQTGMRFYWPDTSVSKDGYIKNRTAICNYPVQNLATAEIIPIAVARLWHYMKQYAMRGFLVNTIHDSAVGEIPEDERELFYELGVKSFTEYVYFYLDKVYNIQFNVPLGVGFKAGEHWSEGEEIKMQVNPPYAPPEEAHVRI